MNSLNGLNLCCPYCKGPLSCLDTGSLECASCQRDYPVELEIPDLRVFPDPYIDVASDRAKGAMVASEFERRNLQQLIEYYYSITSVVPPHHARQYTQGMLAAEARSCASLKSWQDLLGGNTLHGDLLDIGCGTAPLLAAASGLFQSVAGLDVAFRWLVVARKRLQEKNLDAPLICGCVEAIPFPDRSFDFVTAESTVELLTDQAKGFSEIYRVLRPGGYLLLSTPNRYGLGPDPHIGVWGAGIIPESWIAFLARKQGAIPPKRNLFSSRILRERLVHSGFQSIRIELPAVNRELAKNIAVKLLIDAYNVFRRLPISREFLRITGPILHATARKP